MLHARKEIVFLSFVKKLYEEVERIMENFYTFLKYSNLYVPFFFFFWKWTKGLTVYWYCFNVFKLQQLNSKYHVLRQATSESQTLTVSLFFFQHNIQRSLVAVVISLLCCHASVSKFQANENEIAFYKKSEVLNLKKNENGINGVFKVISGFLLFSTDCLKQSRRVHYFRSSCLFDSTTAVINWPLSFMYAKCGDDRRQKRCVILHKIRHLNNSYRYKHLFDKLQAKNNYNINIFQKPSP